MTKAKLRQLKSLLDELLEEEQQNFARDTGIEIDSDEYARICKSYLGRELPRLGEVRAESETPKLRKRARDCEEAGQQAAEDFYESCRALRLKLQRGEK